MLLLGPYAPSDGHAQARLYGQVNGRLGGRTHARAHSHERTHTWTHTMRARANVSPWPCGRMQSPVRFASTLADAWVPSGPAGGLHGRTCTIFESHVAHTKDGVARPLFAIDIFLSRSMLPLRACAGATATTTTATIATTTTTTPNPPAKGIMKSWKLRWCVLDRQQMAIFYYKNPRSRGELL